MSFKNPKLLPWKLSSVETQIDFMIEYNYLQDKAMNWDIELIFFDPCHQLHNTILKKCWQEKWKDWSIILNSNTWRKRVNILSAINSTSSEFTGIIKDVIRKQLKKAYTK